jgi:hypothetical protein
VESRDAIFLDQHTPLRAKRSRVELLTTPYEPQMDTYGINSHGEENYTPGGDTYQTPNTNILRRSGSNTHAPSYLDDYYVFLGEVNIEDDPKTYNEAINCPHSKLWVEAIREELNSMRKNKVWELVSLPNNYKPIGCK